MNNLNKVSSAEDDDVSKLPHLKENITSRRSSKCLSHPIRLPTIDSEKNGKQEKPTRRLSMAVSKVVLKNATDKVSGIGGSGGLFLGAYAAMFGLNSRRKSRALSSLSSIAASAQQPQVIELPTYRLEPLQKEQVRWFRVKILVDSMIKDFSDRGEYNKLTVHTSIRNISQNLRNLSKELRFSNRYKYIAMVEIGENNGQGYHSSSRCLWNTEFDGCISSSRKNSKMFIVATLYVIYTD